MENEAEEPRIFKECILRDGVEYCAEVPAPSAAPQPGAGDAADTPQPGGSDLFGWAEPILADPVGWAEANVLRPELLIDLAVQAGAIFGALLLALLLAPSLRRLLRAGLSRLPEPLRKYVETPLPALVLPALWAGGLFIAIEIVNSAGFPSTLVRIAASLGLAWLIIKAATQFLPEGLRRTVTWLALVIAVLYAFGVLDDVVAWSYTIGPPFGDRRINPPFILQAILTAAVFLFAANWLSKKLKTRVETLPRVEPSVRILLANALQVGLFFAAAILTLAGLNIPLSGLAVLGGAIGVGLGFGMQQIVANFISGVILLTDRSIKPDDVIEVEDTYGVVKSLGLRYASVITRDGKEHLIPNEQLITDRVINWSYSNKKMRIKRRLRVEYETDLRLACRLVVEGAGETPRVLADPDPKCLVMEFGDEAVEIEARFWIDDPQNGINNVGSDVMMRVWDKFQAAGIDIPLRHEDVLITPGSTLKVEMVRPARASSADGEDRVVLAAASPGKQDEPGQDR